jgi:hypothetical protein
LYFNSFLIIYGCQQLIVKSVIVLESLDVYKYVLLAGVEDCFKRLLALVGVKFEEDDAAGCTTFIVLNPVI